MNPLNNLTSLYRRDGYDHHPVFMVLTPFQQKRLETHFPDIRRVEEAFDFPLRVITDPAFPWIEEIPDFVPAREYDWGRYYPTPIAKKSRIDIWKIAHEPGGKAAHHMTHMRHPLETLRTLKDLENYPWPDFKKSDWSYLKTEMDEIHDRNLAVLVNMECTIWETAWYMRRMDILMTEMHLGDEKAHYLLDRITELACFRARKFAEAGADILALGDDIGSQKSLLMSPKMYKQWLKPRLANVVEAARAIKPDILIQYHSCGFIRPLIGDLIEAGVDILNPVQPECMDFAKIHENFGDRLSFNGTLGTQSVMPYGTPEDVRETVRCHLDIAGEKGGLFCCPTHILEPEVPWENILAYVTACREYRK